MKKPIKSEYTKKYGIYAQKYYSYDMIKYRMFLKDKKDVKSNNKKTSSYCKKEKHSTW